MNRHFEKLGTVEIRAKDKNEIRRRVNQQERQNSCIIREVRVPRVFTNYHAMVRYDGMCTHVAVIKPRLFGGWRVTFGRRYTGGVIGG